MHSQTDNLKKGFTAWAEGGACIIDKKKFIELGGFDNLYAPFYWEDIDLSYKAWKTGYKVLFDPNITVIHQHEQTIGAYFSKSFIKTIAYRNQFIFIWKNITDNNLIINHILNIIPNLISLLLKGEWQAVIGFFTAMIKLPLILKKRKVWKINDKQILSDLLSKEINA